jgi:hypothetical protein
MLTCEPAGWAIWKDLAFLLSPRRAIGNRKEGKEKRVWQERVGASALPPQMQVGTPEEMLSPSLWAGGRGRVGRECGLAEGREVDSGPWGLGRTGEC